MYTEKDVQLIRNDTKTIETHDDFTVDQDNYYLTLNNGNAITSFTSGGGGFISTIPSDDYDTLAAVPFYTACLPGQRVLNGYCWPLGNKQTVRVNMRGSSEFSEEKRLHMAPVSIVINEQPGSINLTRLNVSGGYLTEIDYAAAQNDLNNCYIHFIDEYGNEGDVIVGPNPDDNGDTMSLLTEQEGNETVVDSNDSLDLLKVNTATHSVPGLGEVDQDNYYLQLKNGKAITSYTVNSECFQASLTTDSDNLARPFCAMNNGDSIVNAFIWPLGDQQLVDTSVFLGAGESGSKVEFNSDSFPMSVNEKPGCICLTRLSVASSMYTTEDNDFKAYITYTDSSGETGQVIVGLTSHNDGNYMQILDWTDVFSTVDNMNIEFPEQFGASQAVIYANGRNQVPVKFSLSLRDSNNVSIPLTSEDIAAVSSLTSDGLNKDIGELGWRYSSTKGDFVNASYDTQMSRGITANTIYTGTNVVYVSCPRRVQSSITIAYTVTINDVQYSTSTYQSNYNSVQLLHIVAQAEKLLQYRGSYEHDGADSDSDFIFQEEFVGSIPPVNGGHNCEQYNYYISLSSGKNIVKANIIPDSKLQTEKMYSRPWAIRTGGTIINAFVWPLGDLRTVYAYPLKQISPVLVFGPYYKVNVSQRGAGVLCLTKVWLKGYGTTVGNNDHTPAFVELFDEFGNKGTIALLEIKSTLAVEISNGDYY
jgi:hypothetical protein